MKITQGIRDYAATLGDNEKTALNLGGADSIGMSISAVIEEGMTTMSKKFKDICEQVYVLAEAVKATILL